MENQQLPRLTVKEMKNEAFLFFNLEKGIPFTFISLLKKPFETIQTYLNHDRRKYTNPVKYLIFSAIVYMIFTSLNPNLESFMLKAEKMNEKNYAPLEKKFDLEISKSFSEAQEVYFKYQNIITVIIIPLVTFATYLLFRDKYNYAEMMAINCFVWGTTTWISALCTLISSFFTFSAVYLMVIVSILGIIIMFYQYKKIFETDTALAVIGSLFSFFTIFILGMIINLFIALYFMLT